MKNFDDIVFKGRNTSYGAYLLRRQYNPTLLFALSVSLIIFLILVFSIFFYDQRRSNFEQRVIVYDQIYSQIQHNPENTDKFQPPPKSLDLTPPSGSKEDLNFEIVDTLKKQEKLAKVEGNQSDSTSKGTLGVENGIGEDQAYATAEVMPNFPGGDEALQQFLNMNIIYPLEAVRKRIEGTVYVNFIVNSYGEIENIKITQSVNPQLDKECIRVVKIMPRWQAGRQRGKAISVLFTLPVRFNLGSF